MLSAMLAPLVLLVNLLCQSRLEFPTPPGVGALRGRTAGPIFVGDGAAGPTACGRAVTVTELTPEELGDFVPQSFAQCINDAATAIPLLPMEKCSSR